MSLHRLEPTLSCGKVKSEWAKWTESHGGSYIKKQDLYSDISLQFSELCKISSGTIHNSCVSKVILSSLAAVAKNAAREWTIVFVFEYINVLF